MLPNIAIFVAPQKVALAKHFRLTKISKFHDDKTRIKFLSGTHKQINILIDYLVSPITIFIQRMTDVIP